MGSKQAQTAARARRRSHKRLLMGVTASASAAAILGGAIAVADIPDGNTVNACRNATTGALRVVDKSAGKKCVTGEKALSWTNWKNRGQWSAGTAYRVGDIVQDVGSTYQAMIASTGIEPATNTVDWTVIAGGPGVGVAGLESTNGTTQAVVGAPPTVQFIAGAAGDLLSAPIKTTGQKVKIDASVALGSTQVGGGSQLNLWICYAPVVGNSLGPLTQVGAGLPDMTVPQGQRQEFSLSAVISGVSPGLYKAGLCGYGTGFDSNGPVNQSGILFSP